MRKFKHEVKGLKNSFKYAFKGIYSTFKSERNMKIHVFIMILVVIFGLLFSISLIEWFLCIVLFGLVLSAECFNTAIETVIDMVMPEQNTLAGRAKDIAAGGVLVLAIVSVIVGLIIFIPRFITFINL